MQLPISSPILPDKTERLILLLLDWFQHHQRDLPWRRTSDPYAIWVSEIMLQQTQVATVIPFYERWMTALPTLQALAEADPQKLLKLWEGLGYYTRVKNMQQAAVTILQAHDGKFPTDHQTILTLKGIGPYTAGAIASIAFNQPAPILDGNVIRILTRLFSIKTDIQTPSTKRELWAIAKSLVEQANKSWPDHPQACSHFNQAMMELGATVCLPKNPLCQICPAASLCEAKRAGIQEDLPVNSKKTKYTKRYFRTIILAKENRFLVRQRSAAEVNALMWEFPTAEITESEFKTTVTRARREHQLLGTVKFAITRYQNQLAAIRQSHDESAPLETETWKTVEELQALPFSSAQKQVLQMLITASQSTHISQQNLL